MRLFEKEIDIRVDGTSGPLPQATRSIDDQLPPHEIPVRFAVTGSEGGAWHCELAVLGNAQDCLDARPTSIFDFAPRRAENTNKFTAVLLVPTGIGAAIGGHAGDAGPAARLLAAACDTLITHPNVVNASDINELPENGLYVEGSVISRLMMGTVGLQPVRSNRVLLVIDEHEDERITDLLVNSASAARTTLGMDCAGVVKMSPPISTRAEYSSSGRAAGHIDGLERLCEVLWRHRSEFDAVAISSLIDVSIQLHEDYFKSHGEMVNPWGGVEAMLTHAVSMIFDVPSAHAPMLESVEILNMVLGVVDPRMAPEAVSSCFLHCVLKGLHRSPRIVTDRAAFRQTGVLTAADVSCLVIPDGCVGLPTLAALAQGIPVIAVRENRNRMRNDLQALPFPSGKLFIVENYLEAVGVMAALRSGVAPASVRRPLAHTLVASERSSPTKASSRAGVPGISH